MADDDDFDMTMLELGLQDDNFCQRIDEDFDYSFSLILQDLDNIAAKENQEKQQLHSVKDDNFCQGIDEDFDYSYSLMLQDLDNIAAKENQEKQQLHSVKEQGKKTLRSVVDDEWEILDPNPDIYALFQQFNYEFFWGVLEAVEVRWSPRMTLCAGLCCYEGKGRLCSVRLSQPLLKYRPRRDLVETLLHEMIHAYLFVTHNNKDHNAHGPEFLKHMNRINSETGARISVYHSFHDEVDHQRKHWWKCNGPCQYRTPYFGLIKRAMNRAPSSRDFWWNTHQAECGGTFMKIKEPKDFGLKKAKKALLEQNGSKSDSAQMQNFFPKAPPKSKEPAAAAVVKSEDTSIFGASNIHHSVPRTFASSAVNIHHSVPQTSANSTAKRGENLNVHTISSSVKTTKPFSPFTGTGYKLGTAVSEQAGEKHHIQTSNQSKHSIGNTLLHQNTPSRVSDSNPHGGYQTPTPRKFQGTLSAKGPKVSKANGGFGSTRTAVKGGSRTIVLNKKRTKMDNSKTQETEIKTVSFTGTGHVLGGVSTPDNNKNVQTPKQPPQNLVRQQSLDGFLSKKPYKRAVVIFSSDSEDEGAVSKMDRKDSLDCNTSSNVPRNANSCDVSPSSSHVVNFVQCPVCGKHVKNSEINNHLDGCLEKS